MIADQRHSGSMKMSRKVLAALLLGAVLLAAPLVRASEEAEEEADDGVDETDVVVLTDDNFAEKLGQAKFALVEFYAPWCGHCKSLKPEYAKAATALKQCDASVLIAKVDATEQKDVAGKFEVQGYPTLKWFVDGEMAMDYSGGRTADDIVRWVKKRTGPATVEVSSVEQLETAQEGAKVAVLGFFDKFEGDSHAAYEAAAMKDDAATYLKTSSAEVAAKAALTSAPGFALFRNYPDFGVEVVSAAGHPAFASGELGEQLSAFVKAEKLPAFIEFSSETSQDIFGSGINQQVIFTAPGAMFAKDSPLAKAMSEVASEMKGKVVLVTAKVESENGKPITQFFGLDAESKDAQVVGFDSAGGKKYKFTGDVTSAAELKAFAEAVVAGTAPKFFKSAPEPEEPLEGGVAIITGNTVETIVKDPTKDVLLEVYAPWCGHCKALTPIYEKLAKRFNKVDSVVIAKMDGTVNEHPDVEAQGYPTLIFFPAEEGAAPIPYEGSRTLADMTKFIKKNAKVPFELPKKKKKSAEEAAEEEELKQEAAAEGEGKGEETADGHDEL